MPSPAASRASPLIDGPVMPTLVRFSLPIVLVSVLQSGYQLTDAYWVGSLGEAAVATVSIGFPAIFFMTAVGLGLAVAGSTLIAQHVGARDQRMVDHVASQTILLFFAVSAVLTVLGYFLTPTILGFMGADPSIFADAASFMRWSIFGLVFLFGFIMFQSTMRALGRTGLPLVIVSATVLLNFALDPLFIYGYGPIPAMGVTGAAIATFLTQAISAIVGLGLLFSGHYGIRSHLRDLVPDVSLLRRIVSLGLPSSVEQSARAVGFAVMTAIVAGFGTHALAAYGVTTNLMQFVIIPAISLSMATATLAGQSIGAGKIERAEHIGRASALVSTAAMTVAAIVLAAFAPFFVGLFLSGDRTVTDTAVKAVRLLTLSFPFIGFQLAYFGVLRGAGSALATMILTISTQWFVLLPLAYVLSATLGWGLDGVWWAFPVTNILSALLAYAWYLRGSWKNNRLTERDRLVEKTNEEAIIEEPVK